MLGVFMALDLFLFYVMWEVMLVPMYFIVGIWGGDRRIYASIKFFIYTMVGSLLMLVAIVYLGYSSRESGDGRAELQLRLRPAQRGDHVDRGEVAVRRLLPRVRGEGADVPVPHLAAGRARRSADGRLRGPGEHHAQARHVRLHAPRGSALSGGGDEPGAFARPSSWLAVIGIVYGALVSLVQPDFKKLVAYSSVSHLGFVMLGIFALTVQSVQGALMVMINHGISTGALFFLIGMIYERRHTRLIEDVRRHRAGRADVRRDAHDRHASAASAFRGRTDSSVSSSCSSARSGRSRCSR